MTSKTGNGYMLTLLLRGSYTTFFSTLQPSPTNRHTLHHLPSASSAPVRGQTFQHEMYAAFISEIFLTVEWHLLLAMLTLKGRFVVGQKILGLFRAAAPVRWRCQAVFIIKC